MKIINIVKLDDSPDLMIRALKVLYLESALQILYYLV